MALKSKTKTALELIEQLRTNGDETTTLLRKVMEDRNEAAALLLSTATMLADMFEGGTISRDEIFQRLERINDFFKKFNKGN